VTLGAGSALVSPSLDVLYRVFKGNKPLRVLERRRDRAAQALTELGSAAFFVSILCAAFCLRVRRALSEAWSL
jgi:hypothetical protein